MLCGGRYQSYLDRKLLTEDSEDRTWTMTPGRWGPHRTQQWYFLVSHGLKEVISCLGWGYRTHQHKWVYSQLSHLEINSEHSATLFSTCVAYLTLK